MRYLMVISMLVVFVACSNQQTKNSSITNYETPGNLQPQFEHGCIPLEQATNKMTPADLYPDMRSCIDTGDYQKAADLFAFAGTYGWYDRSRVADESAHQAIAVLQMNALGDLSDDRKNAIMNAIDARTDDQGPHGIKELCNKIESIGPPAYYPAYMIQHGMGAVMSGISGQKPANGLVPNFNSEATWKQALSGYLHCPVP